MLVDYFQLVSQQALEKPLVVKASDLASFQAALVELLVLVVSWMLMHNVMPNVYLLILLVDQEISFRTFYTNLMK